MLQLIRIAAVAACLLGVGCSSQAEDQTWSGTGGLEGTGAALGGSGTSLGAGANGAYLGGAGSGWTGGTAGRGNGLGGAQGSSATGGHVAAGGNAGPGVGGELGVGGRFAAGGTGAGGNASGGNGAGGIIDSGGSTGGLTSRPGIGGVQTVGPDVPTGGSSPGGADTGGFGGQPSGGWGAGGGPPGGSSGASTGGSSGGAAEGGGSAGEPAETGGTGSGGSDCPYEGHITYTLSRAVPASAEQEEAYELIGAAMERALEYYNCYTDFEKELFVSFIPEVDTADGNPNGSIRFGKKDYMQFITAAHEIAHTLGVGYGRFREMTPGADKVWTGPIATEELRAITGDPSAVLYADDLHFWPYGLNFTSEYESESDIINHCRMVMAIITEIQY